MSRSYDNRRRAEAAEATRERILDSTESLLTGGTFAGLTLQGIADGAGVTVQTVVRKLGSREGCVLAVAERLTARIDTQRGQSMPGDVEAAIDGLLLHYETDGRLVLNLLAQAPGDREAEAAVARGRGYHEAWVRRCFAPFLAEHPERHDALLVATDIYTWKRVRLDLGRSAAATRAVVAQLIHALMEYK